ncbi:MAG: hypothetical protein ABIG66_00175 [Candidatus Kerfeldbacteria bacterium]
MEKETNTQQVRNKKDTKLLIAIIISSLATALVIGGGMFWWQQSNMLSDEQSLQKQIIQLQIRVGDLQDLTRMLLDDRKPEEAESGEAAEAVAEPAEEEECPPTPLPQLIDTCDFDLPVIVYERAGLLNDTTEGQLEKQQLEKKLINPYVDYKAEESDNILVTLDIIVPENVGEEYEVLAIFENGGTEGFLFGEREGDYDYWQPDCMDACEFSDEYKAKYPEVVQ